MRVLLVQPPFSILRTESKKCHPPLGLAYLAAVLKDNHEVKVLDALAEGYDRNEYLNREYLRYGLSFDDIEKKIREFSPQVVAVSWPFSSQTENVYRILRIAKKVDNKIITVTGGAHPSAVPEEALKEESLDFVILGEGEITTKKLLESIETKKDISGVEGLGFKLSGRAVINPRKRYQDNLDAIPFPYWEILPLEKYFRINNPHGNPAKRIPYLPVVTSRGCSFKCVFCSIHNLWGSTYRKRSAENVLKELEYLREKFGVREIIFEDDNLTLDKERAEKIFQGIINKGLDITWSTPNGIALQTLDDDLLELMKESGCYSISIGVESGDESVLKNIIEKSITLSGVKPVINKAKKLGLETTVFFVAGLPGENLTQIKNTFRFARNLKADNVNFFFATPLPGTRLLELCRKKGLVRGGLDYGRLNSERPYFDTGYLSKKDLVSMVYQERLKLHLLFLFRNPKKFLSKALRKLFNDPAYFLKFAIKYLARGVKNQQENTSDITQKTENTYGFLWEEIKNNKPDKWHYNSMQEVISEPMVRGKKGIDIGSGCGYDTYLMAKNNPLVKIISLEISEGVYKTRQLTLGLENVWIIKGSALNIPIVDSTLDFAYSFGVLHHTPDPEQGMREIARVIKKDSPVYLYLYEDHSESPIKYTALKLVTAVRSLTTKIPSKILYIFSFLASPLVVIFFTLPHKALKKFKITQPLSEKIPFNFGTGLFSLTGDIYDRFGAPIERRFSRQEIFDLFKRNGFVNISISKMKSTAGWVAWGYKG